MDEKYKCLHLSLRNFNNNKKMEENFKKVEAKFKFYKKWIDITEREQAVTVDLIINYQNNTFRKQHTQSHFQTNFSCLVEKNIIHDQLVRAIFHDWLKNLFKNKTTPNTVVSPYTSSNPPPMSYA